MSRPGLKVLLPLAALLLGGAGTWAIVASRPILEAKTAPPEPPAVDVVVVDPQTIPIDVQSQGVARPRSEIDWTADVTGKVIELSPAFVDGGVFRKGEKLLSVDPADYDHAIVQAQARVAEAARLVAQEEAQSDQARNEWQALGEGQPTPLTLHQPQLAEARAKRQAAEAELKQARWHRSHCDIVAPFDGRIAARKAGLGQFLQRGDSVARIFSTDVAEVRLPISLEQLKFLDLDVGAALAAGVKGPEVTLTAELAGDNQQWASHIVRAEGLIDQATGLLFAVAEVPDPYGRRHRHPLMAGLFVQAAIHGKPLENVVELPEVALNRGNEVWVVDDGDRLHIRKVEVLRQSTERVFVRGPLRKGERVVTAGIQIPIEDMKVNPAEKSVKQSTADQ